jgi:hypothetical protein
MYSLALFAEESISHAATDPAAWASLAKETGPVWLFAIISFAAFVSFVLGAGYLLYKIGVKLMDRLDVFLETIQESVKVNAKAVEVQASVGNIMLTNVANMCAAGNGFVDAMQKISKELGIDIDLECSKIRDKLQVITRIG